MDLRLKLDGEVGDPIQKRKLRLMRGYPLDGPGAQRKDCSYGRGKNKIVDLLLSGKYRISDFYSGKFSIEDIASGRLNELISNEKKIFPLLFPEMILFLVATGRAEFTHEKFMDYMREKYDGDLTEEELSSIEVVKSFSKLKLFVTMQRKFDEAL